MKQETTGGRGISWTIRKSFVICSRQIKTPVPHQSVFTGRMAFLPLNHGNSVKALKEVQKNTNALQNKASQTTDFVPGATFRQT